jgi:hypothetical protein
VPVTQQKGAMHAVCCRGISGCKGRARKHGLHDFETVSDPIDTATQLIFAHADTWHARETQDDLGLDAWFWQAFESKRLADRRQLVYCAVNM